MYNGVGLATVRGSGTSGYVQKNWAFLDPSRKIGTATTTARVDVGQRELHPDIVAHEEKRKTEIRLAERRIELEDKGVQEDEIEKILKEERELLQRKMKASPPPASISNGPRHPMKAQKTLKEFGSAVGIDSTYNEADGFDAQVQEAKKIAEKAMAEQRMQESVMREVMAEMKEEEERLKAFAAERAAAKEQRRAARAAKAEAKRKLKEEKAELKKQKRKKSSSRAPPKKSRRPSVSSDSDSSTSSASSRSSRSSSSSTSSSSSSSSSSVASEKVSSRRRKR